MLAPARAAVPTAVPTAMPTVMPNGMPTVLPNGGAPLGPGLDRATSLLEQSRAVLLLPD